MLAININVKRKGNNMAKKQNPVLDAAAKALKKAEKSDKDCVQQRMKEILRARAEKAIKNKYYFCMLIEVQNGCLNGDPDMDGAQRVDPITGRGFVTPMCIKYHIRRAVEMLKGEEEGFKNYISRGDHQNGMTLNDRDECALDSIQLLSNKDSVLASSNALVDEKLIDFMCDKYWDIRTFGAVMTTFAKGKRNCSGLHGPVQMLTGMSIDPVEEVEQVISRCVVTSNKDVDRKQTELGHRFITPYAVFKVDGFINASYARVTGMTEDDLEVLWDAIWNMFEGCISSGSGLRAVRRLCVFKYDSPLGGKLRDYDALKLVEVKKRENVRSPRSYDDYEVVVHKEKLPHNVKLVHDFK